MSFATLERAVLNEAREVFGNKKLKFKDLLEWSTSEEAIKENLRAEEVMARLPRTGTFAAISQANDKRGKIISHRGAEPQRPDGKVSPSLGLSASVAKPKANSKKEAA